MAHARRPEAAPSQTATQPAASPTSSPASRPEPEQAASQGEYPKPAYPDLLHRFDYDSHTDLDIRETNYEKRGNVMLIELNYAGAGGDRVPAYLVLPHGGDNHPAIIWGHWLQKGSPLANKDEFLDEALLLARAGVVSLLVDAPQARHDFPPPPNDLLEEVKQQSEASAHQVIDLRRAVDLLLVRKDIDRKRLAYVGHSWDAHVGAILAGVETRICCYVLMAGGYSDEEDAFSSTDPERIARIRQVGAERVREYFHEYAFDDPVYFVGHTDHESIFLQFASADFGPNAAQTAKAQAQKYLDSFSSKDKQMAIYDAGHALNAAARLDRVRWLEKHLGFKKVDEKDLEAIPQLK
jgi:dienelactone hydrolase